MTIKFFLNIFAIVSILLLVFSEQRAINYEFDDNRSISFFDMVFLLGGSFVIGYIVFYHRMLIAVASKQIGFLFLPLLLLLVILFSQNHPSNYQITAYRMVGMLVILLFSSALFLLIEKKKLFNLVFLGNNNCIVN